MKEDLYKKLNVNKDATEEEIKVAYRKAVRKTHPDRGGDPQEFSEISEAYMVLYDKSRRDEYDRTGDANTIPESERVRRRALQDIGSIFSMMVSERGEEILYEKIIDFLKHRIRSSIGQLKAEIKGEEEKLDLAKEAKSRMKYSGSGEDVFKMAMANMIRMAKSAISTRLFEIKVATMVSKFLDDYKFDAKKRECTFSSSTTVTFNVHEF